MTAVATGTFKSDNEVNVTYEDQQKINKFACLNAKLILIKEEIKSKEEELKTIEDASEEIVLLDDEEKIPYLVGEVYIYQNLEATQASLDNAKQDIENGIKKLNVEAKKIDEWMLDLKTNLYAKFGTNINLEYEDE